MGAEERITTNGMEAMRLNNEVQVNLFDGILNWFYREKGGRDEGVGADEGRVEFPKRKNL